jgi:uncharacterized membrane-anchored protein
MQDSSVEMVPASSITILQSTKKTQTWANNNQQREVQKRRAVVIKVVSKPAKRLRRDTFYAQKKASHKNATKNSKKYDREQNLFTQY